MCGSCYKEFAENKFTYRHSVEENFIDTPVCTWYMGTRWYTSDLHSCQ